MRVVRCTDPCPACTRAGGDPRLISDWIIALGLTLSQKVWLL